MIWDLIVDHIPWWVYLVVGTAAVGTVLWFASPIVLPIWRLIPLPARVAIVGLIGGFLAWIAGRNIGARDAAEAERRRNAEALQKRTEVDRDTATKSDPQVHADLARWNRDDP